MDRATERKQEIESAVADVRAIEAKEGISPASLLAIKRRLAGLAGRQDLFSAVDYPPPAAGGKVKSCLYRVAEDADHRFALYVNSSLGGHGTPAHNHTTWAVIHIQAPLLNFHMYGLALDHRPRREFYKAPERAWRVFPAHSDIREARPGRA
jgi:hypothetical protein